MPPPNGFDQREIYISTRESRRKRRRKEQRWKGLQEEAAKYRKITELFRASSAGQFHL